MFKKRILIPHLVDHPETWPRAPSGIDPDNSRRLAAKPTSGSGFEAVQTAEYLAFKEKVPVTSDRLAHPAQASVYTRHRRHGCSIVTNDDEHDGDSRLVSYFGISGIALPARPASTNPPRKLVNCPMSWWTLACSSAAMYSVRFSNGMIVHG